MFTCRAHICNMVVLLCDTIWSDNIHHDIKHEVLHVLNGHLSIDCTDGRRFPLQTGDILLIPAGLEHRDNFCHRSNLKLQLIHFDLERDDEFFSVVKPEMATRITGNTRTEITGILANIRNDFSSEDASITVNECRLNTILQLIYREVVGGPHSQLPLRNQVRLGAEARHYLEANFRSRLSLPSVAKLFSISSCHLSHIFREENGVSFITFLTNLRMQEAERLLRDTNLSVSEVAHNVGYDNANYFTRIFQQRNRMPPSSFRDTPFHGIIRKEQQ